MAIRNHDISSLQLQVTIARWHLDAAVYAEPDATRQHRDRARNAYESAMRMLALLNGGPAERRALERELSAIRSLLDAGK